jgi:hypothetical protein
VPANYLRRMNSMKVCNEITRFISMKYYQPSMAHGSSPGHEDGTDSAVQIPFVGRKSAVLPVSMSDTESLATYVESNLDYFPCRQITKSFRKEVLDLNT